MGWIILATLIGGILVALVVFTIASENHNQQTTIYPRDMVWSALDDDLLEAIELGLTFEAIERYRQLADATLDEARGAIEYLIANPEVLVAQMKKGAVPRDAGVRDLVRQGRLDEAIDVYREFTGALLEDAQDAVAQIEQEVALETNHETDRTDRADSD